MLFTTALLLMVLSACLLYSPGPPAQGGTTSSELGPPTSIINQDNATTGGLYRPIWIDGGFLRCLSFLNDSSLCQVDIKLASTGAATLL